MVSPSAPLAAGIRAGKYQIVRVVGMGGMGIVYEAIHTDLKKRVALKTLHPQHANSAVARARFLREGEAASRIRHPHVVDVTDVSELDGTPILVMEYLEGLDLDAYLRGRGALATSAALDLILPVVAAVAAGHDLGVIHRDLKPHNIFLARGAHAEFVPKVLDFGVSKLSEPLGADLDLTASAALLGTVAYMSPEQARGAREADERSDQYALGLILYECVTGRRAYQGDNALALLRQIGDGLIAPAGRPPGHLPGGFEEVLMRALRPEPGQRYLSLSEFGRALLPFAGSRTASTWRGVFERRTTAVNHETGSLGPAAVEISPPARSSRRMASVLLAGAAVLLGITLLGLSRRRPARDVALGRAPPSPRREAPREAPPDVAPAMAPAPARDPGPAGPAPRAAPPAARRKPPPGLPAPRPASPQLGANQAPILKE